MVQYTQYVIINIISFLFRMCVFKHITAFHGHSSVLSWCIGGFCFLGSAGLLSYQYHQNRTLHYYSGGEYYISTVAIGDSKDLWGVHTLHTNFQAMHCQRCTFHNKPTWLSEVVVRTQNVSCILIHTDLISVPQLWLI